MNRAARARIRTSVVATGAVFGALALCACSASQEESNPNGSSLSPDPGSTMSGGPVPVLDSSGNPVTDASGNPVYEPSNGGSPGVGPDGVGGSVFMEEDDDVIIGDDDAPPPLNCGDGKLADNEFCDDGDMEAGDGCDESCRIEDGYVCPEPGTDCVFTDYCGDRRVTPPETCDDGNDVSGDGCTETCFTEDGWSCPTPGEACVFTVVCGDGVVALDELCDDGNTASGDGCSADCTVETGWACSTAGLRCTPICGDGMLVGREECDDAGSAEPGCSDACTIDLGYVCETPGQPCRAAVCGDGVAEGGEGCDDGENSYLGDGCSPGCLLEPDCSAADGACVSSCGDGLIILGDAEECDDGNDLPGDGCSPDCQIEEGFDCPIVEDPPNDLPIVYHDFYGVGSDSAAEVAMNPDGHDDFENEIYSRNTPKYTVTSSEGQIFEDIAGPTLGLVNTTLGQGQTGELARKPTYASAGNPAQLTGATAFHQWYVDVPSMNATIVDRLALQAAGGGIFQFDSEEFHPLDDLGLTAAGAGAPGPEPMRPLDWLNQGCGARQADGQWVDLTEGVSDVADRPHHNYSFTSEVRYWFEFAGGEQLTFRGDDDVWVFIKGKLVVDLGGNHEPYGGNVCGDIWSVIEDEPTCGGLTENTTDVDGDPLGLEAGRVYEAVVFQAERHTCQSNYRLTLANFARKRSQCSAVCGDGIIAGDEQCDDGEMNGAGYGFCTSDCTPGPRCGDKQVDPENEECDDGVNLDSYFLEGDECAPGCVFPPYCGDGVVNPAFAEECDNGADQNTGEYDGCNADCTLGPRCGDGVQQESEGCDDGNKRSNDGCSPICTVEPRPGIAR